MLIQFSGAVKKIHCAMVFSILLLSVVSPSAQAQTGTASIQGTITDETGALIPAATVTLLNTATQNSRNVVSDSNGAYSFPNTPIGTYTISAAMAGFRGYTQTNIVLEVGSSVAINIKMTVGATTERVEVRSEGLALQTEDSSFKQTIDQTAITEMPLNGRRMTDLITLSGGSAPAPAGDFTGSKYSYAAISVSIAGGNGNTTSWRLDGGDNNDYMANANLPFPFPDAVSQFSVESTALGATGGSHSGGLVNVVTRSGTNSFHGTAFEFIRNNYLNATNFFSTCKPVAPATTCSPKDSLHQNQYGGTFGGPVRIPHLFDGRDKLFFFAGYQFNKAIQATSATQAHVPTAANLQGDFSLSDPTQKLVNPVTGAALVNNQISPSFFNAQSLALVKYLPTATDATGLVSYAIPSQVYDKQFVTRMDYTVNPKNNLYARYFLDGYQAPAFFSPTNILITTSPGNVQRVQTFVLGEVYSINSRIVNSFRASISRRSNVRGPAPGITACTLGITLSCPLSTGLQMTIGTTSTHGFNTYCGTCAPGHFNDNALAIADDVTMTIGKHQLVFGGEYVRNQLNIVGAFQANGNFTFNGQYSANGPGGGSNIGDANLDFLTGSMSAFSQSKTQQNALRGPIPSLYIQDTFHASKRVTMFGGVRWVPQFFPVDYFNRGSIFSMSAFMANQVSSVYPTAPAGSFFYGDAGVSRQFTKNSPWQFSPSVGVSFDPVGNGKTVIRAGAEIAYDQVNYFTGQRVNQNPPFATSSSPSTSAQLCFSNPWLIGGTGAGCSQVGGSSVSPYPQPGIPTAATAVFPAQGQFIVLPTQYHPSYTIQYTASIQRDLGRGWQLQLIYIGNGTRHAPLGVPLNNAVFIPGVWGAGGTGCSPIVTTGPAKVTPGAAGTPCSTTGNQKSRFALAIANPAQGNQYQGGGGGSVLVGDGGTANYNGLVTTIQHRLSSSFSLLVNHTWSKCLNVADGAGDVTGSPVQDPTHPGLDYGPCGSDYRNIENVVLVTKSKFPLTGFKALLANNWVFAPLVHIQSGAPFNVTQGSDISLTAQGNDRPNLIPGVPVYLHPARTSGAGVGRAYLNPAAFTLNTVAGTYGNIRRNSFRGIPIYQVDAQISRIFDIHEGLHLDLRLEAFNVINHPNFANPSSSNPALTNTTFGQISGTSVTGPRIFQGGVKLSF